MQPNIQSFRNNFITTRAFLGSSSGINQQYSSPSIFRFGNRVLYELVPGYINNTFVDSFYSIRLHILNRQILKHNYLIIIYKFATLFMRKIFTSVGNTYVSVIKNVNSFLALRAIFGRIGYFALNSFKVFFILLEPSPALNCFTITEGSKSS